MKRKKQTIIELEDQQDLYWLLADDVSEIKETLNDIKETLADLETERYLLKLVLRRLIKQNCTCKSAH